MQELDLARFGEQIVPYMKDNILLWSGRFDEGITLAQDVARDICEAKVANWYTIEMLFKEINMKNPGSDLDLWDRASAILLRQLQRDPNFLPGSAGVGDSTLATAEIQAAIGNSDISNFNILDRTGELVRTVPKANAHYFTGTNNAPGALQFLEDGEDIFEKLSPEGKQRALQIIDDVDDLFNNQAAKNLAPAPKLGPFSRFISDAKQLAEGLARYAQSVATYVAPIATLVLPPMYAALGAMVGADELSRGVDEIIQGIGMEDGEEKWANLWAGGTRSGLVAACGAAGAILGGIFGLGVGAIPGSVIGMATGFALEGILSSIGLPEMFGKKMAEITAERKKRQEAYKLGFLADDPSYEAVPTPFDKAGGFLKNVFAGKGFNNGFATEPNGTVLNIGPQRRNGTSGVELVLNSKRYAISLSETDTGRLASIQKDPEAVKAYMRECVLDNRGKLTPLADGGLLFGPTHMLAGLFPGWLLVKALIAMIRRLWEIIYHFVFQYDAVSLRKFLIYDLTCHEFKSFPIRKNKDDEEPLPPPHKSAFFLCVNDSNPFDQGKAYVLALSGPLKNCGDRDGQQNNDKNVQCKKSGLSQWPAIEICDWGHKYHYSGHCE